MEVNSGSASSTSYSRPANRLRIVSIKDVHDLAHGGGGIPKRLLLLVAQVELDDLLDAGRAHLHRHAHVQTVDAVLALEVRRARKEALLVEQHRVDHLRARRSRWLPRRPRPSGRRARRGPSRLRPSRTTPSPTR